MHRRRTGNRHLAHTDAPRRRPRSDRRWVSPVPGTQSAEITSYDASHPPYLGEDGRSLWRPAGPAPLPAGRFRDVSLRLAKPENWPRAVVAWGHLGDKGIVAIGSVGGAVWLWEVGSEQAMPGPLGNV